MPQFEQRLGLAENRAERRAARIIKRHFEMHPLPTVDQHGRTRHGWNRDINRWPMPVRVADFSLSVALNEVRAALHKRVAFLMAKNPVSELRLGVLYAMADILGVAHVRDWDALWSALEAHNWTEVVNEMLLCNWNGLVGTSARNRQLFSALITAMLTDTEPEGLM